MSRIVKYIVANTYKPLLVRYLSSTRSYVYKGITVEVPPKVFHPGFFSSTKLLLRYLEHEPLEGKSFLELGAGSGLISICAAKRGADVVASDISWSAIRCVESNAGTNRVMVEVIHSDLFLNLPLRNFDFIVINPPYYKQKAVTEWDRAWNCGEKGEYFEELFRDLRHFMHSGSKVLMVLCDGCDLEMISEMANDNSFEMICVHTSKTLLERNFIFQIEIMA
jgi:release factor glutamine methyltransferase